jgi:hypothetical protein
VTRRVRRVLIGLGYCVHTPGELYGTREEAYGASDVDWLRRVAGTGWIVIGRDLKITQRRQHRAVVWKVTWSGIRWLCCRYRKLPGLCRRSLHVHLHVRFF